MRMSKLAKKFIARITNSIDKQLKNESFSVWKLFCSKKRQQVYIDNIKVLNERKAEHEEQIAEFRKKIETNESRQKHLVSKMQS